MCGNPDISKITKSHYSDNEKIMNAAVNNAIKRSLIVDNVIYNPTCCDNK